MKTREILFLCAIALFFILGSIYSILTRPEERTRWEMIEIIDQEEAKLTQKFIELGGDTAIVFTTFPDPNPKDVWKNCEYTINGNKDDHQKWSSVNKVLVQIARKGKQQRIEIHYRIGQTVVSHNIWLDPDGNQRGSGTTKPDIFCQENGTEHTLKLHKVSYYRWHNDPHFVD